MPETHSRVAPIRVRYTCDTCGHGEMISTGSGTETAWGKRWLHECDRCGQQEVYADEYPTIRYLDAEVYEALIES